MKKTVKIILGAALAATLAAGTFALAGCTKTEYVEGEYTYTQYGTAYGFKVRVGVQGDRISSVEILDSDYVAATDMVSGDWKPENWTDNQDEALNAFRGAYVKDILALQVKTDEAGVPVVKSGDGFVNYGDNYIVTGATQSSGRLMLAVQNALAELG